MREHWMVSYRVDRVFYSKDYLQRVNHSVAVLSWLGEGDRHASVERQCHLRTKANDSRANIKTACHLYFVQFKVVPHLVQSLLQ